MALKAIYDKEDEIPDEFRSLYTEKNGKWEVTGIEGIKTTADTDRLQVSLNKERDDHKKTKEKLGKFGELDPDKSQALVTENEELRANLETAEAAAGDGKPDEAAIDKLVEARVATVARPLERQIAALEKTNGEQAGTITAHELKDTNRTISDAVREAGVSSKIIPTAMDDALMLGERMFEVTESGEVLTRDGVGVTPGIDPVVWLSEMQDKRAHWWPASNGGGAGGGGGGGGTGSDNPFTSKSWNMTKQGQMLRTNPEQAERMAKSAGTTVGGPKPMDQKSA